MSSKKSIFIIPGYRHVPTQKAYQAIAAMLNQEGYDPILVTIPWNKTTISENTEHFLRSYRKIRTKKKYILGFSFGAMIAFLAATKVAVEGVILCSLSPYFQEDLLKVKKRSLSPIQADRRQDFLQLHSETLAKQLKVEKILMVYGSKESRSLIKRVKKTYADIESKQKMLIPVKHVDHAIGDNRYLQTIQQIAKQLN